VPVGLTAQEYAFLAVAVGPAIIAAVVVWLVWRWAKRSEAEKREEG
jgi:Flp pilus assembly pilin Flp